MRFLLDTHTLIWALESEHLLGQEARNAIANPEHERMVSIVSLWEIAIKTGNERLALALSFDELIAHIFEQGLDVLPIKFRHLATLQQLPHYHRDPFDRLLIAQAQAEKITLISKDRFFTSYNIDLLW